MSTKEASPRKPIPGSIGPETCANCGKEIWSNEANPIGVWFDQTRDSKDTGSAWCSSTWTGKDDNDPNGRWVRGPSHVPIGGDLREGRDPEQVTHRCFNCGAKEPWSLCRSCRGAGCGQCKGSGIKYEECTTCGGGGSVADPYGYPDKSKVWSKKTPRCEHCGDKLKWIESENSNLSEWVHVKNGTGMCNPLSPVETTWGEPKEAQIHYHPAPVEGEQPTPSSPEALARHLEDDHGVPPKEIRDSGLSPEAWHEGMHSEKNDNDLEQGHWHFPGTIWDEHKPDFEYVADIHDSDLKYYIPHCQCGWKANIRSEAAAAGAWSRHVITLDEQGRRQKAGPPTDRSQLPVPKRHADRTGQWIDCEYCDGQGCEECRGSGLTWFDSTIVDLSVPKRHAKDVMVPQDEIGWTTCWRCQGGKTNPDKMVGEPFCAHCKGSGLVPFHKTCGDPLAHDLETGESFLHVRPEPRGWLQEGCDPKRFIGSNNRHASSTPWAYHATMSTYLRDIAEKGLLPRHETGQPRRAEWDDRDGVYFSNDKGYHYEYGNALLRFPWPHDQVSNLRSGDVYEGITKQVHPDSLEVALSNGTWHPLGDALERNLEIHDADRSPDAREAYPKHFFSKRYSSENEPFLPCRHCEGTGEWPPGTECSICRGIGIGTSHDSCIHGNDPKVCQDCAYKAYQQMMIDERYSAAAEQRCELCKGSGLISGMAPADRKCPRTSFFWPTGSYRKCGGDLVKDGRWWECQKCGDPWSEEPEVDQCYLCKGSGTLNTGPKIAHEDWELDDMSDEDREEHDDFPNHDHPVFPDHGDYVIDDDKVRDDGNNMADSDGYNKSQYGPLAFQSGSYGRGWEPDAFKGCEKCSNEGWLACKHCDGTGAAETANWHKCADCSGKGCEWCKNSGITHDQDCEKCFGTGREHDDEGNEKSCPDCDGNGELPTTQEDIHKEIYNEDPNASIFHGWSLEHNPSYEACNHYSQYHPDAKRAKLAHGDNEHWYDEKLDDYRTHTDEEAEENPQHHDEYGTGYHDYDHWENGKRKGGYSVQPGDYLIGVDNFHGHDGNGYTTRGTECNREFDNDTYRRDHDLAWQHDYSKGFKADASAYCTKCDGDPTPDCKKCKGTGSAPDTKCGFCKGSGEVNGYGMHSNCNGEGCNGCNNSGLRRLEGLCPSCKGMGGKTCTRCKGEGYTSCKACGGEGDIPASLDDVHHQIWADQHSNGEYNTTWHYEGSGSYENIEPCGAEWPGGARCDSDYKDWEKSFHKGNKLMEKGVCKSCGYKAEPKKKTAGPPLCHCTHAIYAHVRGPNADECACGCSYFQPSGIDDDGKEYEYTYKPCWNCGGSGKADDGLRTGYEDKDTGICDYCGGAGMYGSMDEKNAAVPPKCETCGAIHDPYAYCPGRDDDDMEVDENCVACGEPSQYCGGGGPDSDHERIINKHYEDGVHDECSPAGCEDADTYEYRACSLCKGRGWQAFAPKEKCRGCGGSGMTLKRAVEGKIAAWLDQVTKPYQQEAVADEKDDIEPELPPLYEGYEPADWRNVTTKPVDIFSVPKTGTLDRAREREYQMCKVCDPQYLTPLPRNPKHVAVYNGLKPQALADHIATVHGLSADEWWSPHFTRAKLMGIHAVNHGEDLPCPACKGSKLVSVPKTENSFTCNSCGGQVEYTDGDWVHLTPTTCREASTAKTANMYVRSQPGKTFHIWREHRGDTTSVCGEPLPTEPGRDWWIDKPDEGEICHNCERMMMEQGLAENHRERQVLIDKQHRDYPLPGDPIPGQEQFKVASKIAATYYHVAPREMRESIEQHGIDYRGHSVRRDEDAYNGSDGRAANYLWKTQEAAENYIRDAPDSDVYEVTLPRKGMEKDPYFDVWPQDLEEYPGGAVRTNEPIHPSRIRRITAQIQRHCVLCKNVFSESEDGEATGFCGTCREKEGLVDHHSWSQDAQKGHYGAKDEDGTEYQIWELGSKNEYMVHKTTDREEAREKLRLMIAQDPSGRYDVRKVPPPQDKTSHYGMKLYHHTPVENRESIQEHGLQTRYDQANETPSAVYFSTKADPGLGDVWEVDSEDLTGELSDLGPLEPAERDGESWYAHYGDVPAHKIKRVGGVKVAFDACQDCKGKGYEVYCDGCDQSQNFLERIEADLCFGRSFDGPHVFGDNKVNCRYCKGSGISNLGPIEKNASGCQNTCSCKDTGVPCECEDCVCHQKTGANDESVACPNCTMPLDYVRENDIPRKHLREEDLDATSGKPYHCSVCGNHYTYNEVFDPKQPKNISTHRYCEQCGEKVFPETYNEKEGPHPLLRNGDLAYYCGRCRGWKAPDETIDPWGQTPEGDEAKAEWMWKDSAKNQKTGATDWRECNCWKNPFGKTDGLPLPDCKWCKGSGMFDANCAICGVNYRDHAGPGDTLLADLPAAATPRGHRFSTKQSSQGRQAIIGVGVPGSGKSTFLKPYADRIGAPYLSTDAIRAEINGSEDTYGQRENDVFDTLYQRMHDALDAHGKVVVDATYTEPEYRRIAIDHLRKKADEVHAIVFDTPLDVAKERNQGRDRKVPDEVIERMHSNLQHHPPTEAEGLTSVTHVGSVKNLPELV